MKAKLSTILIALFLIATSCSGSKTAANKKPKVDPVIGTWNVVITNTPQGDIENALVISKSEDDVYAGQITAMGNSIDLDNVVIAESVLSSTFVYEGMDFELKGTFADAVFNGEVVGMGSSFPANGVKAVE
jgi:hypothetical protein